MASEATKRKKLNRLSSIFLTAKSATSSPTSASPMMRNLLSKSKPRAMTESSVLPVLQFNSPSLSYDLRSASPEPMDQSPAPPPAVGAVRSNSHTTVSPERPRTTTLSQSRSQTTPYALGSDHRTAGGSRTASRPSSTMPHPVQMNGQSVHGREAARPLTAITTTSTPFSVHDASISPPLPPATRGSRSSSSSSILYPLPQHGFDFYPQSNSSSPQLGSTNPHRLEPGRNLSKRMSEVQLRTNSVSSSLGTRSSSANHQLKPPSAVPNSLVLASYNFADEPADMKLSHLRNSRRMSWLPKARIKKDVVTPPVARAWIASRDGSKPPYDVSSLAAGEKCEELWNDQGNCTVHLFPREYGKAASFKIDAALFSSSPVLTQLAHGQIYSGHNNSQSQINSQGQGAGMRLDPQTQQLHYNVPGSPPTGVSPNASYSDGSLDYQHRHSSSGEDVELWLKIPLTTYDGLDTKFTDDDLERLILIRNLFAFLQGGRLVATAKYPTFFMLFRHLARMLNEYGFTNLDQTGFGEVATTSFSAYVQELELADVRQSPEKNLEALVMSEGMKSSLLWNEVFPHGVGRLKEMVALDSIKFSFLSPTCVKRLERDSHFLGQKLDRINTRLSNFDYPELFHGIMNSQTAPEREVTRFEEWKTAFHKTRTFMLNYLKQKYGSWPPRKIKKNTTGMEGLNRMVLQDLYAELAVLYEAMVDRQHPSPRLNQQEDTSELTHDTIQEHPDRRIEALRKVLKEYDYSSPPVYPAMMFDAPLLPCSGANVPGANSDSDTRMPAEEKLPKSTLVGALKNSYHQDMQVLRPNILMKWQEFELKATRGMQLKKLGNFRLGSWLFIYVVLQALPMVTVDAPGLNYTQDVQYFLGQPARGRLPWSPQRVVREYYHDPISGNVIQTTVDAVELSIEAIYKRASCWKMGEVWAQNLTIFTRESLDDGRTIGNRQEGSFDEQNELSFTAGQEVITTRPIEATLQQQQQTYYPPPAAQYAELMSAMPQGPYDSPQQRARSEYYPSPGIPNSDPYQGQASPVQLPVRPLTMAGVSTTNLSDPQFLGLPLSVPSLPLPRSRDSSPAGTRRAFGSRNSSLITGLERLPANIPELHPLDMPPTIPGARDTWSASSGSRESSPGAGMRRRGGGGGNRNSSLITGLERMPYQFPSAPSSPMVGPDRTSRVPSGTATFDQILASHALEGAAAAKGKEKTKEKSKDRATLRGRGRK